MMEEFIAPTWEIELGSFMLKRVFIIDVWSGRDNPVDLAVIDLDPRVEDRRPFVEGTSAEIRMGYVEKGLWPVFAGEIVNIAWGEEMRLQLRGQAEALRKTRVTRTFVDATPQEIVAEGVAIAGITKMVLGQRRYPARHHFVAQNLSIIDLIRLVARTWGIDWPWFCDVDGTFYFCSWEETGRGQEPKYTLEHGLNIFELTPPDAGGRGRLTTILLPFLRHSDRVHIEDRRYWQRSVTAVIEKVHHRFDRNGGRTTLEWTLV